MDGAVQKRVLSRVWETSAANAVKHLSQRVKHQDLESTYP